MAITTIIKTEDRWLIFFGDDGLPAEYFNSAVLQETRFNDDYWIYEQFTTEKLWLVRLLEFGIIPVYPTPPPPPPPAPNPPVK